MNIKTGLRLQKAKNFARNLHKDHTRLSGEKVYEHTQRVQNHLKNAGVQDDDILIGAVLHQALTFSNEINPIIEKEFGPEVLEIVQNYHHLSNMKISHEGTHGINEKYIIQTYLNLASDLRVLLIRLADKVDNIQTAFALPIQHRVEVAEKALYIYAPISRLLGLMQFTKELENGAFKVLQPREYYLVKAAAEEKQPQLEKFFDQNIPAIRDLLKENGINSSISYRVKHLYSIYKKALEKGGAYDMAAMRIVVSTIEDCYSAEALLSELWDVIPEARDDYIKSPKPSGYKSIHNLHQAEKNIQVEVQIRTKEMHEFNEYGPASHVFYKTGTNLKENLAKNPDWLKNLVNWRAGENTDLTTAGVAKNVYAFTPLGDIIELPEGSTPVDFAYAIHTKVGHKCVGAIVNGGIAALDYQIKNGDQIEIRTLASKKKPSADWLKFVKSSHAKTEIKKALNLTNVKNQHSN